jgi:hypothetical protein
VSATLPGRFLAYAVGATPIPQAAHAVGQAVSALRTALAPWTTDRDYPGISSAATTRSRFAGKRHSRPILGSGVRLRTASKLRDEQPP